MDDAARVGIEHRRLAGRAAVEAQSLVKEQFDAPRFAAQVLDDDFADVDVALGIDGVVAAQAQAEGVGMAADVGDDRLAQIGERALPAVVLDPGDRIVRPHTEAEALADVVLQSDVRIAKVGEPVLRVEGDQEGTVSDKEITWHFRGVYPERSEGSSARSAQIEPKILQRLRRFRM